MSLDKLAKISPAGINSRPTDWDAYTPSRDRRRQKRRETPPVRLLEMAAPERDPESLDLTYHFDPSGVLLEVAILDRASGHEIAVLDRAQLARMESTGTPGMLFERKG